MIDKSVGTMMQEFHDAFGAGDELKPVDKLILRRKLIKEEYEEVMVELDKLIMLEASYEQRPFELALGDESESYNKLCDAIYDTQKKLLKELCDLTYVSADCAHTLGMNFDGAMHAVHQSNMSKLGDDGKPVLREDGKILKGPNYKKPNMEPYI